MSEHLQIGDRCYDLKRWPPGSDDLWRAWDTADQYLLETAGEPETPPLLINDAFGALAVPLAGWRPVSWSDSLLARLALANNLESVGLEPDAVAFVPATEVPAGKWSLVLARIPKSLAFWEDSLRRLRPQLAQGARVLAGGMIKHTPRRAYTLLEECIGPTRTSLGWKKARLAEATVIAPAPGGGPLPDTSYELVGHGVHLHNGPNVFARDHLDVGTRVLLPHLPSGREGLLVDLGCGNGALAIALGRQNPSATIMAVDESYQAVASAAANLVRAGLDDARCQAVASDGLDRQPAGTVDLVVCNPPFHQDRVVGDALAWRLFRQSQRALVVGGRLLVVGNCHLAHGRRLARIFGNARSLARDGKFEVLESIR